MLYASFTNVLLRRPPIWVSFGKENFWVLVGNVLKPYGMADEECYILPSQHLVLILVIVNLVLSFLLPWSGFDRQNRRANEQAFDA